MIALWVELQKKLLKTEDNFDKVLKRLCYFRRDHSYDIKRQGHNYQVLHRDYLLIKKKHMESLIKEVKGYMPEEFKNENKS